MGYGLDRHLRMDYHLPFASNRGKVQKDGFVRGPTMGWLLGRPPKKMRPNMSQGRNPHVPGRVRTGACPSPQNRPDCATPWPGARFEAPVRVRCGGRRGSPWVVLVRHIFDVI